MANTSYRFSLIARMMRSHSRAFRAQNRGFLSWPLLLTSVMAVASLLATTPILSAGTVVARRDSGIHSAATMAPIVRSTPFLHGIRLDRAEFESRDDHRASSPVDGALAAGRIAANIDRCMRLDPIVRDVTSLRTSSAICGYDATAPPQFLL